MPFISNISQNVKNNLSIEWKIRFHEIWVLIVLWKIDVCEFITQIDNISEISLRLSRTYSQTFRSHKIPWNPIKPKKIQKLSFELSHRKQILLLFYRPTNNLPSLSYNSERNYNSYGCIPEKYFFKTFYKFWRVCFRVYRNISKMFSRYW